MHVGVGWETLVEECANNEIQGDLLLAGTPCAPSSPNISAEDPNGGENDALEVAIERLPRMDTRGTLVCQRKVKHCKGDNYRYQPDSVFDQSAWS